MREQQTQRILAWQCNQLAAFQNSVEFPPRESLHSYSASIGDSPITRIHSCTETLEEMEPSCQIWYTAAKGPLQRLTSYDCRFRFSLVPNRLHFRRYLVLRFPSSRLPSG